MLSEEKEEKFEALCAALRSNDPDTSEIHFARIQVTQYGHRLGEALQGNNYVSSMELYLSYLLDHENEEGSDSVELLLHYIRESEAMRKVYMRSTDYLGIDETLVPLFLLAIAENPCIVDLNLDRIDMEPFAELLARLL